MGCSVTVYAFLQVDSHEAEKLEVLSKVIKDIPEVVECYQIAGKADYLLKILVNSIEGYDVFYKSLIGELNFLQVGSNFTIETLKYTTEPPFATRS